MDSKVEKMIHLLPPDKQSDFRALLDSVIRMAKKQSCEECLYQPCENGDGDIVSRADH